MSSEKLDLVDRGRGLQLSTVRVTVQDLVPYFQEGCTTEEILRWIPALTREEVEFVRSYYREHQVALDEEDREIRECVARRKNPEWVEKVLAEARIERLEIMDRLRKQQLNGEPK